MPSASDIAGSGAARLRHLHRLCQGARCFAGTAGAGAGPGADGADGQNAREAADPDSRAGKNNAESGKQESRREPRRGGTELVISRPALREEGGIGGPILADFLAMGGGRVSATPPPAAASGPSPPDRSAARNCEERGARGGKPVEVPFRERRLVVAALQQREALLRDQRETQPRQPVRGVRLRAPGSVPQLFKESYSSFQQSQQAALDVLDGDEQEAQAQEADAERQQLAGSRPGREEVALAGASAATRPRRPRLRVLPWHREELCKMLCRSVLFHFLQDRRSAMGLRAGEQPLWFWEARRAQEHSAAGQVAVLVKYLVETELHIAQGPERRESPPGSMPLSRASQKLRAERRLLVQQWEAAGQRLSSRDFHEDAFVRAFLDGHLSWSKVRDLVGLKAAAAAAQAACSDSR